MKRRMNGEGTIYQRKDGRWCCAYYGAEQPPKRHFVYGKTSAEVKQKLKDVLRRLPQRKLEVNPYPKLGDWVFYYLENYKKNELKKSTYGTYLLMYNRHIKDSAISDIQLSSLTANQMQKFYNHKTEEGYSSKTIRQIYVIINSALEAAFKMHYITENVNKIVILPKKKPYEAKVLSTEYVAKIINEAEDDTLYPIVVLTMFTGMRKGEVMALKWENVDFGRKILRIEGSLCRVIQGQDSEGKNIYDYEILEPKTRTSKRVIPLTDKALDVLRIQKERQEKIKKENQEIYMDQQLVFAREDGRYLSQRSFMTEYHKFLKKYGVPDIRFHDLRHTFASLLLEAGESAKTIQEILGHSTITTTMDIYAHVSSQEKIKSVQKLEGLIEG